MKKILLILSLIITFNVYSSPKLVDFVNCSGLATSMADKKEIRKCVNLYFIKGYEIIGTRMISGRFLIDMALIERK